MTKVSVVIPVYNQGQYLAQAIESVLNQTYADVEVVVVNDGSTDQTEKIISAYLKDARLKYISQENHGLPAARNRGIAEASGSYLCFLDSDDYYQIDKIARQVAVLEQDSLFGLAYCDILTVDEMGAPVAEQYDIARVRTELSGNIFRSLMIGGYFPPHTVMVRRGVLEKVGLFDEELGGHADYDLWLRISAAGYPAYYLDEKLAFYRTYPTSMSKDAEHMDASRKTTLEKICRTNPDLIADAMNSLQMVNEELHTGNQWLNQRWKELVEEIPQLKKADSEKSFNALSGSTDQILLVDNFNNAKVISGKKEQAAVWDVDVDGKACKALFLDAPAQLEYSLPASAKGRLSFSIALHPQVWDNAESGACKFSVLIDQEVAISVTIDPSQYHSQRCWHFYSIDVPQNSQTMHSVVFASQAVGPTQSFRWACWGNPIWMVLGEKAEMKPENKAQSQTQGADKRLETLLSKADTEFVAGNVSLAADYLQQAVDADPTNPQILNAYGNILLRLEKIEDARLIFARAVAAAPQATAGYTNLAVVYIMLGNDEEAQAMLKKALVLDPASPEALQLKEHLSSQSLAAPLKPATAAVEVGASQMLSANDRKLNFFLGSYAERAKIWNELGSEHIVQQLSIGTSLEQISVIPEPKADTQMADGLPVPPRSLRMGYYMDDTEGFLRSGKKSYDSLCGLLEANHVALKPGDALLDWGCATGRVLRYFAGLAENCAVWGSDVDAPAIEWCTQYLNPPFKFLTATGLPYLPFEQNTFKFIYGLSVFTHITSMREMWLLELARILKKDGVAIMTVHNEHSWATFRKEGMPAWVPEDLRSLPEIPEWGLDLRGDFWYQSYTFFHTNYLRKVWGQYFDIVDIVPKAEGYQTAVVMKKK